LRTWSLALAGACRGDHLGGDLFGANPGELVEASQDCRCVFGQVELFQQPIEHFTIVQSNREFLKTKCSEQVVNHQACFNIAGHRETADRVKVTLHELPVASSLGILSSPDRGDVVPLEGSPEGINVLGHEACQRDSEVKPQADVTPSMVLETIELAICFLAPLAGEDLQVFQRGRVDRAETK